MGDSDVASQAEALRNRAAGLLQDAARCSDPVRRDALLRGALARLGEARLLLDGADGLGASRRMETE